MMFSICIPTFNREQHLNNCLNSILLASKNVKDFEFEVCVSDNNSNYDIEDIIQKYKSSINIKFNKNKKNLGFSLNAIKSVNMASGKFAWLIGNDDLILPHTLLKIKNLIFKNPEVEYFFLNSYFLNSKYLEKYSSPTDVRKLDLKNLKSICSLKEDRKGIFWDVIDPKVSWDFLIGIFLSVFKREQWLKHLNVLDTKQIEDTKLWSNFDNTCTHPKILASAFKNSNAYICTEPLSINLIGEREWYSLYEFVEIVRIPELLDFYRSIGMPFKKYLICKNFALRNFANYLAKILIGGKKRGLHYLDLKKNIILNLYFPNVYLSSFYFLSRFFKKILKKI